MTPRHSSLFPIANGKCAAIAAIPKFAWHTLSEILIASVNAGQRLVALFAAQTDELETLDVFAITAADELNTLYIGRSTLSGHSFESITPRCPQAHMFEREIAEQFGVIPNGHPALKPVRFHHSWRHGYDAWGRDPDQEIVPGFTDFTTIEGEQIHEVGVGPVHAGVIEPGHFRFQCFGEEVLHLEIALGYQHRGIEKKLINGPDKRTLHFMETLAGDTTIGHTTAYCQIMEALGKIEVPPQALAIRGIALELERLANHTGDLGALALDIGYLPTSSFCGRIRGDYLNMSAVLCGSRFGRNLVIPGGVAFEVEPARRDDLLSRLENHARDTEVAVKLLWETSTVMSRFEEICPLSTDLAQQYGIVGPAARASGVNVDVRSNHPAGIFKQAKIPIANLTSGDVYARAFVRWQEIQNSLTFVRKRLQALPATPIATPIKDIAADHFAVALVEGWRGEICHVALTDNNSRFSRYKVVDPSFHNWFGLALALRNQEISDFPLCNKSFNLSYCGHDL